MKRIYLILLVVAFMAGCSQREDKKAKLEKLRGEYSQLGAQIKGYEVSYLHVLC